MNRKQRRAEARKVHKLGFAAQQTTVAAAQLIENEPIASATFPADIPEPGYPFPSLKEISPAKLAANRLNAQKSTGPLSETTRAVSAQNHLLHGLARHQNTNFKLVNSERPEAFAALKQALETEHAPTTETESILVNSMVESHWLSQRAQCLQDTCIDSDTGAITDEKKFSLYLRYQTTHTRAFHKSLNDLLKLRAEKRKAEIGFEAQRIATEKHEMKKQSHYWDVLKKDCEATNQMTINMLQNLKAQEQHPGFEAKYDAELAKRGLKKNFADAASEVA
jgi:hypothetical protein